MFTEGYINGYCCIKLQSLNQRQKEEEKSLPRNNGCSLISIFLRTWLSPVHTFGCREDLEYDYMKNVFITPMVTASQVLKNV